jgi:hypothetical protein
MYFELHSAGGSEWVAARVLLVAFIYILAVFNSGDLAGLFLHSAAGLLWLKWMQRDALS